MWATWCRCRAQLPVWQRFAHETDLNLVSVAIDAQGSEAVRPFTEGTENSYPTLIDTDNVLGRTFGFKVVPNGLMINAAGRIDGMVIGGFDIRRPESRALVEAWLAGHGVASKSPLENAAPSEEAQELFQKASIAVKTGDRQEAVKLLKVAYTLEPDNHIIRKQLWALEHPERFYDGEIDHKWQRDQLERN